MADAESTCSLTDKYKIKSEDDDSKTWARLLDFESPIKTESDWYSTQTFQVFLDSLDINQPSRSSNESKKPTSNGQTLDRLAEQTTSDSKHSKKIEDKQERDKTSPKAKHDKKAHRQPDNFETILSAEALKILSDLPDLSHMSATRSFIYPATIPATGMGIKTRVKSSKR